MVHSPVLTRYLLLLVLLGSVVQARRHVPKLAGHLRRNASDIINVKSAGSAACEDAKKGCMTAAKESTKSSDVGKIISVCKELRTCKTSCRMVQRPVKVLCSIGENKCKAACAKKFATGNKKYRKCNRSCKKPKAVCKTEARPDKRVCTTECRGSWLTPACKEARKKVLGSAIKINGKCVSLVSCINIDSE